jgi:K+-transporting ATPase ATPase C chain
MTRLRNSVLMTCVVLSVALLVGFPGASGALVAQETAALKPALDATAGATRPTVAVQAAPLYFHAPSAVEQGVSLLPARLVPSATAARSYVAHAAGYRATHNLDNARPVPSDMLTDSLHQMPHHLRPEDAMAQAHAIAAARGLSPAAVQALIAWCTDSPLGFVGEPRVNVRLLNLALDDLAAR